jgi:hypothetical protein
MQSINIKNTSGTTEFTLGEISSVDDIIDVNLCTKKYLIVEPRSLLIYQ